MNTYPYREAKEIILSICRTAVDGKYDTRDKFMAMVEKNPNLAVQGYNPHGKIFYWNDAAVHLYGHSEAEAVNQDIFELILPPEMRGLARDMISCAAKTGNTPAANACDLIRKNGDLITVFSGHLVFKWDGSYPEFYCIDLALETESDSQTNPQTYPVSPLMT